MQKKNPFSIYKSRLARLSSQLQREKIGAALLISSAPHQTRNRDSHYPYRPLSDLYYLTGFRGDSAALFLSNREKQPVLIIPKPDPVRILWEGKDRSVTQLARGIGARVLVASDLRRETMNLLKGIDRLYFQNTPDTLGFKIARELIEMPSHRRVGIPSQFHHLDELLEPMRLLKEEAELRLMQMAAAVTNEGLFSVVPMIRAGTTEFQIKETLDYTYRMMESDSAFETIVATGPSAATLHYRDFKRTLKHGDLLLIDTGAEHEMYAADISRTLPVGGRFDPLQRVLYQAVLDAQTVAMQSIKHGVTMESVYKSATYRLIEGLIEARVLKGTVRKLYDTKAFRPYFPHSIGHTLGIDVHDVGNLRAEHNSTLKAGMVVTIEPGLYFAKAIGQIKPCGIRIEDDVVVTKSGCEVLTEGFPKEIGEIEELMLSGA